MGVIRERVNNVTGRNEYDLRQLFHEGDILKVRTERVKASRNQTNSRSLQLTMYPKPEVIGYDKHSKEIYSNVEMLEKKVIPESLILWWNGTHFKDPFNFEKKPLLNADQLDPMELLSESEEFMAGRHKRFMMEYLDKEDRKRSNKTHVDPEVRRYEQTYDNFMKYAGNMTDIGGIVSADMVKFEIGESVDPNKLPPEWRNITYFQEKEAAYNAKIADLRKGKKDDYNRIREYALALISEAKANGLISSSTSTSRGKRKSSRKTQFSSQVNTQQPIV